MYIERVDPASPDRRIIAIAAGMLREGRLVAFPTETVYGLGANALDGAAVEKIYHAKGRPSYNPLIVHVASAAHAREVVATWTEAADALARHFWPGPLTLVLPKLPNVPDGVTAGLPNVAVRVPSHPVARALLNAAALPVAAPSANKSTEVSPTTGQHVAKSLGNAVDLILDAGPTTVGIESTVIDLSSSIPTLLRPGSISIPQLEAIVGEVRLASDVSGAAARPSPGMLDKHYAPHARVIVVDASEMGHVIHRERDAQHRVGIIAIGVGPSLADESIILPNNALGYAARLYDALHSLDDRSCDVIVIERVPDEPSWMGIADRIRRAATR
ncbi:MAG TPA: L-threonylcarbamoyladenylate synthase [Gemmatimonadaceae bacterium]|jgi:L-threonylcarbamoyladenylate synthase